MVTTWQPYDFQRFAMFYCQITLYAKVVKILEQAKRLTPFSRNWFYLVVNSRYSLGLVKNTGITTTPYTIFGLSK